MSSHHALHAGFELVIGKAAVDPGFRCRLLLDPSSTVLDAGLTLEDASIVAGITALDLRSFCSQLLPLIYGQIGARTSKNDAIRHAAVS